MLIPFPRGAWRGILKRVMSGGAERAWFAALASISLHAVVLAIALSSPFVLTAGMGSPRSRPLEVELASPAATKRVRSSGGVSRPMARKPTAPSGAEPLAATLEPARESVEDASRAANAGEAPTAGVELGGTAGMGARQAEYFSLILERLNRLKSYPPEAKRRREQGSVEVVFGIGKDGTVGEPRLVRPSPFADLNRAALLAVVRLGRVPAVPDEVGAGGVSVRVPFVFELH